MFIFINDIVLTLVIQKIITGGCENVTLICNWLILDEILKLEMVIMVRFNLNPGF